MLDVAREPDERAAGVGEPQARVFENLVVGGPATLTQLARRVGVTKQALAPTVTRMVKLGYLDEGPHPRDGRARLIAISARGLEVVAIANEVITGLQLRWRGELGAQDWARLRELLISLNAAARP